MRCLIILLVSLVAVTGCAPRTARLYATDVAGPPLELKYKGGKAWVGTQAAPTCHGEYRTSAASIGVSLGSAVLNCENGRVLECEFEFSDWTGQGTGTCVDNQQMRYRVLF